MRPYFVAKSAVCRGKLNTDSNTRGSLWKSEMSEKEKWEWKREKKRGEKKGRREYSNSRRVESTMVTGEKKLQATRRWNFLFRPGRRGAYGRRRGSDDGNIGFHRRRVHCLCVFFFSSFSRKIVEKDDRWFVSFALLPHSRFKILITGLSGENFVITHGIRCENAI